MILFPVVILAGGLATRLRPLTESFPKALVKINGEPFVAHQLRLLKRKGINEVIMCLGYLAEHIIDFVGDGEQFGLKISYHFDGPTLLGTAGAIRNALPNLPDNFFVLNGDSYLPCNYKKVQEAFLHQNKPALMTVYHNQDQGDLSNIEFNHQKIIAYDKQNPTKRMQHIDYGLEIFQRNLFENIPSGIPYDLSAIYQSLILEGKLAAFEVKERFYENGSFQGIIALEKFLSKEELHGIY